MHRIGSVWEDRSRLEQCLLIFTTLLLTALTILVAIVAVHGIDINKDVETKIERTDYVYTMPQVIYSANLSIVNTHGTDQKASTIEKCTL